MASLRARRRVNSVPLKSSDLKTWRLSPKASVSAEVGSPIAAALDTVFARFRVERLPPADALRLELDVRRSGRWVLVAQDRPMLHLDQLESLAPVLEAMLIGIAVRSRDDAAALHAAEVRAGPQALLLIGGKGSGKSTLAARFASHDSEAIYGGDEVAFVSFLEGSSESFPKAATLKAGAFALFEESATYADPIRGPVRYVQPARAAQPGDRAEIGHLFFPKYEAGQKGAIDELIEPHLVALELVRQSFGGLERHPRMIDLIARLALLPSHRIVFSDAASAIALMRTRIGAVRG
jgi:hypothetical protein